jgi:hypothetical protein
MLNVAPLGKGGVVGGGVGAAEVIVGRSCSSSSIRNDFIIFR